MKYAEKFYCAIALLLMSSGVVVAENKEVFSKNTHVGNATGYCITISRMDKKAFSDNKSVYYMPDGYLETTIAATTDVPRPIKLHVVFYNVSTNDSVQRCAGKKYKEKDKHFYYEFDAISLDDVP
ncbi:hypothetical protein [Dickeya dadantii]|uniref:hypothetical protein n=1 Tax=Dickeya dadantii TaxID=204038 RepID=UPI0013737468|nr:hypothetical protein [Dickeya dadantii]NAT79811.1 hypothetical protein [Dickeya dadantii]NPE65038.1 hypothetical protein [Dickeya dadantii]